LSGIIPPPIDVGDNANATGTDGALFTFLNPVEAVRVNSTNITTGLLTMMVIQAEGSLVWSKLVARLIEDAAYDREVIRVSARRLKSQGASLSQN
jgi:hypothetical protein